MTITFISGSREGERISFDLKNPVLIGRSRSAQIRLPEVDVAGRHAEITKSDGGVLVTCRSRHGLLRVNGVLVNTDESRPLSVGDEIAMGVRVRFTVDDMDEEKVAIEVDALTTIKILMTEGETAKADEALKELLAAEPNNLQAKMLYGTCRHLLGDEETFKRIHDEIASEIKFMPDGELSATESKLWEKFHGEWMDATNPPAELGIRNVPLDELHLYASPGYFPYQIKERKRRERIWRIALLLATPFLFWLAWWLGQRF